MANQLIGTIVSIGQTVSLSTKDGNSFTKRELVISIQKFDPNTGQPYSDKSNTPQITFMNAKCSELDKYQVGQLVSVSFDVTGTPYTDRDNKTRIINDIRGYRIEPYGVQSHQRPTPAYPQPQYPQQPAYGQVPHQTYGQAPHPGYPQQTYPSAQPIPPAQPQFSQPQAPTPNPQVASKKDDGLPF